MGSQTHYYEKSRSVLKEILLRSRGEYSPKWGFLPTCPLCLKILRITDSADLHEALITRGDVRGSPYREQIFTAENCVLVHHICHMGIAGRGGNETFEKCARYLVKWEGLEAVCDWLTQMTAVFPSVATTTFRRFMAIDF